MSTAVYYSGCLDVHPPLSREHAAIVEDVINLRESERAKPVFAAIRASDEPDLPYYGGQLFVSEDGTTLQVDDDEQRYGLLLWFVHLLKHFFTPNGYTLNGEIQWYCPDDIDDLGIIQHGVTIVDADINHTIEAATLKHQYGLGYADSFAAALALNLKATLVSADPGFENIGKSLKWLKLPKFPPSPR